jgi:predicted Zn-dependent protease
MNRITHIIRGPWPFASILLSLSTASCHTVPYTGRSQLNIIDSNTENQMGLQAFQQALSENKTVSSGSQAQMVQNVAKRIAAAADRDAQERGAALGFDWQVVLIDSPAANAWCLPGGKMGVYTGILPVTQSEAGLAVVLGHEVGHAIARHGGERITQQMGIEVALQAVQIGISKTSNATQQTVMTALGVGAQVGVLLPFSRSHESEADHIGIILMAKAGYDPHEAPKLWERMSQTGGGAPPEFLSTHPSNDTRIKQLNGWMQEALQYYQPGKTGAAGLVPQKNNQKTEVAPPPVPKVEPGKVKK